MKKPYADPDCPKCGGSGWIYAKRMITLPGEKGGRDCDCTLDHHRRANMEKIWPSLSTSKSIPGLRNKPPLAALTKKDLWITAREPVFRAHLQAVAYRRHHMWNAKVWTDKDIVKAWLNTAYAQGHKIYDTELDDVRVTAMYIDELVEPYDLVVLKLGDKSAANREAPFVLIEALKCRMHLGRPTWIVDQPDHPINRVEHRCYSEQLEGILNHWPHILVRGAQIALVGGPAEPTHPVSDMSPDDLIEDEVVEDQIEEALSDLDEDEEEEEGGDDDEEDEDEGEDDDDDDDDEEWDEEEEEEDDDDVSSRGTRSFLDQMAQNEETQEQQARRKAYKKSPKKTWKKGGRR